METLQNRAEEYTIPILKSMKETAKDFGLTLYAVQTLVHSVDAHLFTIRAGKRIFINQKNFAAYLNGEFESELKRLDVERIETAKTATHFGVPTKQPTTGKMIRI